jgi:hypothetical protein
MLFKQIKTNSTSKIILRYLAEITIIFLGITISFLFDQWREEIKKKNDLIECCVQVISATLNFCKNTVFGV